MYISDQQEIVIIRVALVRQHGRLCICSQIWLSLTLFATYLCHGERYKIENVENSNSSNCLSCCTCLFARWPTFCWQRWTLYQNRYHEQEPGISHFFQRRSVLTLPRLDQPILCPTRVISVLSPDHSYKHYPTWYYWTFEFTTLIQYSTKIMPVISDS